jgi:hypothetical protein
MTAIFGQRNMILVSRMCSGIKIVNLFSKLMLTSRGIDKAISVTNVTIWTEWMQCGDSGIEADMPNRGDNGKRSLSWEISSITPPDSFLSFFPLQSLIPSLVVPNRHFLLLSLLTHNNFRHFRHHMINYIIITSVPKNGESTVILSIK